MAFLRTPTALETFRIPASDKASATDILVRLGFCPQADYIAAHVRQGDYLKVASHVVTADFAIQIVRSMLLPSLPIVWFSDDPLDQPLLQKALPDSQHYFLIGGDALVTHALMRGAKVVIASNSSFSFTAAILGRSLCFSPSKWFGECHAHLHSELLLHSSAMVFAPEGLRGAIH